MGDTRITRLALLGLVALLAHGCMKAPQPPLRVGVTLWPPAETFFLAQRRGHYGDLPLQLIDYPSLAELHRALDNGVIDAAILTADHALQSAMRTSDTRIILVIDVSHGGDVIVARPQIGNLRELKGKRVGVEATALSIYILNRALDQVGLTTRDVTVVSIESTDHESAFEQRQIDALVTFEPLRTRLLSRGAREIFSSKEVPWEVIDVMVVRKEVIEHRREDLIRLLRGHFRALDLLKEHPAEVARIVAPREGIPPEQFLRMLDGVHLVGLEENRRLLGGSNPALLEPLRRLAKHSARFGLIERGVDPAPLIDGQIVGAVGP